MPSTCVIKAPLLRAVARQVSLVSLGMILLISHSSTWVACVDTVVVEGDLRVENAKGNRKLIIFYSYILLNIVMFDMVNTIYLYHSFNSYNISQRVAEKNLITESR